jgi:hypothetical protein
MKGVFDMSKSFIKFDGAYKKIINNAWQTVSTTLPSVDTFNVEGMSDLSVLDRKQQTFIQSMIDNGSLGIGKVFKSKVDLQKYIQLVSINVR